MIHAFWTLRDEFDWNYVQTCGVTLVLDERLFDLRMQSRPSSNFLSQPAVNATDNFQYPSINASTAGEMEVKNYSLKTRQQLISLFVFVFFSLHPQCLEHLNSAIWRWDVFNVRQRRHDGFGFRGGGEIKDFVKQLRRCQQRSNSVVLAGEKIAV